MSSTCGNCDCSDQANCVKKGNSNTLVVVETVRSYIVETPVAENGGCNCGTSCSCTTCTCGH